MIIIKKKRKKRKQTVVFDSINLDAHQIKGIGGIPSDCFYIEKFADTCLNISSSQILNSLNSLPNWKVSKENGKYVGTGNWILPSYPFMKYRGNELNRFKCFFYQENGKGVSKYYYTGWQKASMFAYQSSLTCPEIDNLMKVLSEKMIWKKNKFRFNQSIVTKYRDWQDNIGAHQDKPIDITPNSPIIIITLCKPGNERTMVLTQGETIIWKGKLKNGSMLILGDKANGTYKGGKNKQEIKHEILKGEDPNVGERISIVVRDISSFVSKENIYKDFVKHVKVIENRIMQKTGKRVNYENLI